MARRKTNITFAIDSDVLQEIKRDAEQEGLR